MIHRRSACPCTQDEINDAAAGILKMSRTIIVGVGSIYKGISSIQLQRTDKSNTQAARTIHRVLGCQLVRGSQLCGRTRLFFCFTTMDPHDKVDASTAAVNAGRLRR